MRASEFSSRFTARLTSGQVLDIRYDPLTHALTFCEGEWSADARGAATPRSVFREQLETTKVKRLMRSRAA